MEQNGVLVKWVINVVFLSFLFKFFDPLEDIYFPHTLVVLLYVPVLMNCSVLKFEDQIMKTFLESRHSTPLLMRNFIMGIKLPLRCLEVCVPLCHRDLSRVYHLKSF